MEDISEKVYKFLEGNNPMERVVAVECDYDDENVYIIYNRADGEKRVKRDDFKPFVWVKESACVKMCGGDRKQLKKLLSDYNIGIKTLNFGNETVNGSLDTRLQNSYKFLFYAKSKMSFSKFQRFFQIAKTPIYPKKKKDDLSANSDKEILCVAPNEQYMIASSLRLFKGYDNYDELKRCLWDIETTGLNPEKDTIDQIGIRTNKGFEEIINVEGETLTDKKYSEHLAIRRFLEILKNEKPDVIAGHNSENFDWNFLIKRSEIHGYNFSDLSLEYFVHPIYKKNKENVLKLGGEVEYFKPTIMWGTTILDSMHAVRRAQATNSDIKSANLKYVTKYLDLKKPNRVYVPGGQIGTIWRETNKVFAFNNEDGDWYHINDENPLKEGYELVSGEYIVKRYLLDDIWETDKVEVTLNAANFLISKMLPTSFNRAATMGTAGIWKLIMLAWCYENGLAVPSFTKSHSFTGGLSRLLKTGYADNVVKLDYNSLYPSIMLTWGVKSSVDVTNAILNMLNYVLTNREKYKDLKAEAGEKAKKLGKYLETNKDKLSKEEITKIKEEIQQAKADKNANDNKQLPLKILGNSVFGSFGSPSLFNFGDQTAAEKVTCIGRMSLRLMISHFNKLNYTPIVGDSVVGDTPLFIKYNDNNCIDIKPISEIFDSTLMDEDMYGRQYDTSQKNFKVLCRSGWSDVHYVYRHKTTKDIYEVKDEKSSVECTQDHSLFDDKQKEIKPTEITKKTKLEYYSNKIEGNIIDVSEKEIKLNAKFLLDGTFKTLNYRMLNMSVENTKYLLSLIRDYNPTNKTCLAQIMYLNNKKQ